MINQIIKRRDKIFFFFKMKSIDTKNDYKWFVFRKIHIFVVQWW